MDKSCIMKLETESCLTPATFWRTVTLFFSFLSSHCCTFLPGLENTTSFNITALLEKKCTRKLIWKPLLMRFGNPRGPHKKLNYWAFAWTKSMSFFSYSYDLVNQSVVRWMISECWCVILESTLTPRSFIFFGG